VLCIPAHKFDGAIQTCGNAGSPEVTLSYSFFDSLLFRCLYLEIFRNDAISTGIVIRAKYINKRNNIWIPNAVSKMTKQLSLGKTRYKKYESRGVLFCSETNL
jgi:hypothetical protein